MKDRIPGKPGRVLISPENGASPFYATMALADEPQQEGTALSKASLLSDPTVSSMRMPTSPEPTVDLALKMLSGRIDNKAEKSDNKYDHIIGSYTGNGQVSRTFGLGFRPAALILLSEQGTPFYYSEGIPYYLGGFVTSSCPISKTRTEGVTTLSLTSGGFTVYEQSFHGTFENEAIFLNSSGTVYNYIAFRAV